MAEKNKLIPFSPELEKAIEDDAARCRRPFVRQVEAVLLTYYGLENVELERVEKIGELAKSSKRKIPLIEAGTPKASKKKSA